jgi:hypothetical protein
MIHIDGFEQFRDDDLDAAFLRADYISEGTWTTVSGRAGASAAISGKNAVFSREFDWGGDKFSCGCAHQFTGRGSALWINVGDIPFYLWMNPDTGTPMLDSTPGGSIPTINRWYFFELIVNRTTATVTLQVNGKPDATVPMAGPALTADKITVNMGWLDPAVYRPTVTPVPVDNWVKTYDDFYARDGDPFGPVMVTTRFPTADALAEWFLATTEDTDSHAQVLSMMPPDPLDNYVASDTPGKQDIFESNASLYNLNEILATGVVVLARKAPTLDANLGVFIGGNLGGVERRDAEREVGADWKTQYVTFDTHGNDTPEKFEASQFGIIVLDQ